MRGTGPDEARGRRCVLAVLLAACAAACGGEGGPVESTVTSDPPAAPAAPTAMTMFPNRSISAVNPGGRTVVVSY